MKSIFVLISLFAMSAWADPKLTNVTSKDFEEISKDMSANFVHNSMLGASKMGSIFGFEVGVVAAQTQSSRTNDIVKRNAGAELPNLYNAGVVGAVGIPFGIAFEAVLFPKMTFSGASLNSTSLGLKWNINDVVPVLPINVALRGVYSTSALNFSQDTSGVATSVENKNTVSGVQLLISPMFPILEPYAGVGMLSASNELSVTGTTIFDPSFSSSMSEKKTLSGTQLLVGLNASLALLKIGVEYSSAFDTSRYGVKLAVGF